MFVISLLFPDALLVGFEYFEESEQLQFNEINVYLFFFAVAYRWKDNGEKIQNLDL